ncbi:Spindle and kinetochore-associated protein 1 [Chytriomyces hyalinus]|nr:Spindle and kinetochore-associated protein 1 [Chytriomyces hyalinus]
MNNESALYSLQNAMTAMRESSVKGAAPFDAEVAAVALFDAECKVRALRQSLMMRLHRAEEERAALDSLDSKVAAALDHLTENAHSFIRMPEKAIEADTDPVASAHESPIPSEEPNSLIPTEPAIPAAQSATTKLVKSIAVLSLEEYEALPKYLLNRMSLDKVNASISEFNKLVAAKYTCLKIPHMKMTKQQRDRFWEHKKASNDGTKGKAFLMEREIKENWWGGGSGGDGFAARRDKNATGPFKLDTVGRAVLALVRHLGRIKEVRGGGDTRIVIV